MSRCALSSSHDDKTDVEVKTTGFKPGSLFAIDIPVLTHDNLNPSHLLPDHEYNRDNGASDEQKRTDSNNNSDE